jgi:tetratricopeptide (TPR) repeat protein
VARAGTLAARRGNSRRLAMRRLIWTAVVSVMATAAAQVLFCDDARAENIVIMVGNQPISGEILSHSETSFEFKPSETGIPVRLRWADLAPLEAKRIQQQLGIGAPKAEEGIDGPSEPVGEMIDALKVTLKNQKNMLGIELRERSTPTELYLSTRQAKEVRIPRSDVLKTETVKVRESEVMSLDDMYRAKLAAVAPKTAKDNYDIAEYCRSIGYVEAALEHVERCTALDPGYAERLKDRIAELRALAKRKQAYNLYIEIKRLIAAGSYDEAIKRIDLLNKLYPDSEWTTQLLALLPNLEEKRKDELRRSVVTAYYLALDEGLRNIVYTGVSVSPDVPAIIVRTKGNQAFRGIPESETNEEVVLKSEDGNTTWRLPKSEIVSMSPASMPRNKRDATFAECKAYATDKSGGITRDATVSVAKQFNITEDDCKKMWEDRLKKTYVMGSDGQISSDMRYFSFRQANYGKGSWLREGVRSAVSIAMPQQAAGGNRAAGGAAQGGGPAIQQGGQQQPTDASTDPEDWWKAQQRETRLTVLRAICYEAILDVVKVTEAKCSNCGGNGTTVSRDPQGGAAQSLCSRCHGVTVDYSITCR